jgi:hypothetical protein
LAEAQQFGTIGMLEGIAHSPKASTEGKAAILLQQSIRGSRKAEEPRKQEVQTTEAWSKTQRM